MNLNPVLRRAAGPPSRLALAAASGEDGSSRRGVRPLWPCRDHGGAGMSDYTAGFVAAVGAAPQDDTPRLIFADWLQDHGDEARAELIRVQCELARLEAGDPRRPGLRERELRLLWDHQLRWLGPLAEHLHGWEFHRGFLHHVCMTARAFLVQGP